MLRRALAAGLMGLGGLLVGSLLWWRYTDATATFYQGRSGE